MDRISLEDIYTFCSTTPNTQNMVEGENILNSGCISKDLKEINILGMCLQTSAIRDKPHNIAGSLQLNENGLKVTKLLCTCKARNSQKCKHIVSTVNITLSEQVSVSLVKCLPVFLNTKQLTLLFNFYLIYLFRNGISSLEPISLKLI